MAPFTGFTARKNLYKNREGSSLASQGERNSVLKDWKSLREDAFRSDKTNQMLSQLRTEVARLSQRSGTGIGMHPFKIYNFPSALRRFHNDNDWRRLKVRSGLVNPNGCGNFGTIGYPAIGSDESSSVANSFGNTYMDGQVLPNSSATVVSDGITPTWNEFLLIEDDATYIFWFSFVLPTSGKTNFYHYGLAACKESDPTTATILNTGETFNATNSWPSMDINDLYNYKIGTAFINNTFFSTEPKGLLINQYQFGNIQIPGSPYGTNSGGSLSARNRIALSFRGLYDDTIPYYVGDTVTIIYADGTTVNSAYQFVYDPDDTSAFNPQTLLTPMTGTSPNGNSPDPWKQLSKSPIDADYHTGVFDITKYYLRTA